MLNISLSGMLWTVVNLLVLYVLMKKFLWKPVTDMIESRQKEIEGNLAAAETQRAEAEREKERYRDQLTRAGQEAAGLVAQAKARGEREYQSILAKAQEDANQVAQKTRAQLEAERTQLLRGARQEVASLALLAAAKVAGKELDADADRAILDDFLTEAGDGV